MIGAFGWRKRAVLSALGALVIIVAQVQEIESSRAAIRATAPPRAVSGVSYKLVSANILGRTTSASRVNSLIADSDAHIVILQEFNESFRGMAALEAYPHSIIHARSDDFGTALFSKFPLTEKTQDFFQSVPLNISAEVATPSGPLLVVSVHLIPPANSMQKRGRDHQLDELVRYASTGASPIVVAGDFNLTPFTTRYRTFIRALGLSDARSTLGFAPTWPAFIPILWMPIDHVFTGRGAQLESIRRGPFIWSDHFPLEVTLSLPPMLLAEPPIPSTGE